MSRGVCLPPASRLPASPAIPASPFSGDTPQRPECMKQGSISSLRLYPIDLLLAGALGPKSDGPLQGLPIRKPPLPRGLLFGVLGEDQPARPLRYSLLDDELDDSSTWPFLLSHIAFQALSYRLFGNLRDSQPYSSIRALLSSFDLSPFSPISFPACR